MGSKEVLKMTEKKVNRDRHRKYTSWEQMVSTSCKSIARANPVRVRLKHGALVGRSQPDVSLPFST